MNEITWDTRESGPEDASSTILLLPGGLCSGEFFADVMRALDSAPVRVIAATVPGMGRTPAPSDLSIENYARLAGRLAQEVGADVVGGHSLGANIALEMVAGGHYDAPLALLSPTFSREDEVKELAMMNRLGYVPGLGALVWRLMIAVMPRAMKKQLPPDRADALAADLANNDPAVCRQLVRSSYVYLDHHGTVAGRLCDSGTPAVVAFGDRDEVGLRDDEREVLEACPTVTLTTVEDSTHMLIVEQPERTAELLLDFVQSNRAV